MLRIKEDAFLLNVQYRERYKLLWNNLDKPAAASKVKRSIELGLFPVVESSIHINPQNMSFILTLLSF